MENGFYGAFCDAGFAVNALIGVNVEHFVPFVETLNGANDDAIGISASYARLGNDVGHGCENLSSEQKTVNDENDGMLGTRHEPVKELA